jgi:hypothetical protein
MHVSDLRTVTYLVKQRQEMLYLLKQLNLVNGGEPLVIPSDVLGYVDQQLAAKGLISLLIESLRKTELEIVALGVRLDDLRSEAA